MWRVLFLIALFYLFFFKAFAQNNRTDSLLSALRNSTPSDYSSVFSHLEQSLETMEYTQALKVADQILSISQQLPFKGPLPNAYRSKAMVYNLHKHGTQALQFAQEALRLSQEYCLPIDQANSLQLIGKIYYTSSRADLALQHYLHALEIYQQRGHQKYAAKALYEIGNLCYYTKQYSCATEYLLKAYELGKDSLDNRQLISDINTLALIHRDKKEFSQAIYYQKLSQQIAIMAKDSAWIGITTGNLGHIYQLQENYEQALQYYQLDISLSKKFNMWGSVASTFISIADIHLKKRNYLLSKTYLDSALHLANSLNENRLFMRLYNTVADYYHQEKQFDKAYQYQRLYYAVKDSLETKRYAAEIEKIRSSYELEKKQAEIELLKKNNEMIQADGNQKFLLLIAISIILFCIASLASILYRNNRQKHRANLHLTLQQKELADKNEQINQLNNALEKKVQERTQQLQTAMENLVRKNEHLEHFAYVISHNLRAPIARIMGLVSIFNKDEFQDKTNLCILEYLHTAALNLDTVVNDLNDILLIQDQVNNIKEEVLLEEVTQTTIESLRAMVDASSAHIHTDYSQVNILLTIKSYINSILYNLISNAIKYKSPERTPEIILKTSKVQNYICLTVQDNGLGLDLTQTNTHKLFKLYQRMHHHIEGKGMGLFIVKEQVEALNGKIEVEGTPGQGCAFHIYLPA